MKVANYIEDGRLAGPQLRIVEVAKRLKAFNIFTTVICPVQESVAFRERLAKAGIEIKPVLLGRPSRSPATLLAYVLLFVPQMLRVWVYLRRERFDLVHCSGGAWQIKGAIAGKLAGSRVIWHLNDTNMPKLVYAGFRLLGRFCADAFIVAGSRVRAYYRLDDWKTRPVYEIQAPIDTAVFDPDTVQPNEKVASLPGMKVVTIANVNPNKDIETFIAMAGLLNDRLSRFYLSFVIVGPIYSSQNAYYRRLTGLIECRNLANVQFFGACNDVSGVLKAADVFVCTSRSEASPMVVWEAMAMRRAIVCTDVGDVPRFIVNDVSGYVVPVGDVQALATAVEKFVQDPQLREKCGRKARQLAFENLDITICVQRHRDAYLEAASMATG